MIVRSMPSSFSRANVLDAFARGRSANPMIASGTPSISMTTGV
jgi:hypothetical protein